MCSKRTTLDRSLVHSHDGLEQDIGCTVYNQRQITMHRCTSCIEQPPQKLFVITNIISREYTTLERPNLGCLCVAHRLVDDSVRTSIEMCTTQDRSHFLDDMMYSQRRNSCENYIDFSPVYIFIFIKKSGHANIITCSSDPVRSYLNKTI